MSHTFYNSEAIFNTIGDYPVVDQFDVSYTNSLAGSMLDNYVTGSMFTLAYNLFTGENYYSFNLPQLSRGLAFNKLSTNSNSLPSIKGAYRSSYEYQPQRERLGILRSVRIFSNSERFYDSLVPPIDKFIEALGGKIFVSSGIAPNTPIIYLNAGSSAVATIGMFESFPFEPKFSNINRTKNIADSFTAKYNSAGSPLNKTLTKKTVDIFVKYNSTQAFFWSNLDNGSQPVPIEKAEASKVLFGFGDQMVRYYDSGTYYGSNNSVGSRKRTYVSATYDRMLSPVVRGWKYGLIDGNPHYTSCVFRKDRFGQYRDMLEQRLYSAFVNDEENAPLASSYSSEESLPLPLAKSEKAMATTGGFTKPNILNSLSSLDSLNSNPPVRVNFTRQTYIESTGELLYFNEKPINTWSSNLSMFVTSSLPYFDGINNNRPGGFIVPNNLAVISTLSDIFGNITIGT